MKKLILIIAIITASTTVKANYDHVMSLRIERPDSIWLAPMTDISGDAIEYQPVKGYYQFKPKKTPMQVFSYGATVAVGALLIIKGFSDATKYVKSGSPNDFDLTPYYILVPSFVAVLTFNFSIN